MVKIKKENPKKTNFFKYDPPKVEALKKKKHSYFQLANQLVEKIGLKKKFEGGFYLFTKL